MIELLFKASLAIAIALLFYKLVLQQESFFATNRLYLLGCIVLAFTLPFISIPKLVNQQGYLSAVFQKEIIPAVQKTPEDVNSIEYSASSLPLQPFPEESALIVSETSSKESSVKDESYYEYSSVAQPEVQIGETALPLIPIKESYSFSLWIVMFYLFGVAVFSLSLIYQVGVIFYKILTATDKVRDGDCVIVTTQGKQAPCSFFNYIFIHPDDYDFKTYEQIIAHEKIHVKLGHSLDMLFAELAIIVLWFNPLIWLFRKEIEKNNEYQTDAMLLEKEQVRKETYQLNLLQIAVPNKPLNITTNYNQSLIKQRIIMMNSKKSTTNAYWKYSFLLPLFFGMLLLINEPAASQEPTLESSPVKENVNKKEVISEKTFGVIRERNKIAERESAGQEKVSEDSVREPLPLSEAQPEMVRDLQPVREAQPSPRKVTVTKRSISTNIQGRADMTKGVWYSSREDGELCIQFKGNQDQSSWNIGKCFAAGAFQNKGEDLFVLTKETGSLELTGNFDAEVGQGKYIFKENPAFKEFLASNNITGENENMMFHLFLGNVDRSYITFLKSQYGEIEARRLTELAIHGVTEDSFRNYIALFEKHSNKIPSIREVVEARIHGINEAYVQEIQEMGFKDLSLKKMMEAKIHGVNATYAKSLREAGFKDLSMDKIIQAKIHGVDASSIKENRALGFIDMSLNSIIQLRIHGVDANFISDLKKAGLTDLSLNEVVQAKIHGLNSESIKELRNLGFNNLSFRGLITAQIHGVNSDYVKDLQKAGFDNLSMDKIVSAKIHGVNSNFIEDSRKNGYNLNSLDKYISLKIHGRAMESLKKP